MTQTHYITETAKVVSVDNESNTIIFDNNVFVAGDIITCKDIDEITDKMIIGLASSVKENQCGFDIDAASTTRPSVGDVFARVGVQSPENKNEK